MEMRNVTKKWLTAEETVAVEMLPAGPLAGLPGKEPPPGGSIDDLGDAAMDPPGPSKSGEGAGAYIISLGRVSGGARRGANCCGPGHRG